ncbi:MAG TPA: tyrosine-type recombinase/integrase [Pirellulales bacterium]
MQEGPNKGKIDKRDERGRTVDVHALRHTFGTLLSKGGVSPRTAQAAMRHSDVNLTMNTYTDPKLLDVAGAMESLPLLPLGPEAGQSDPARNVLSATETDDSAGSPLAPTLAPTSAKRGQLQTSVGQLVHEAVLQATSVAANVTGLPIQDLRPLSIMDNGRQSERATRFERATTSLGS